MPWFPLVVKSIRVPVTLLFFIAGCGGGGGDGYSGPRGQVSGKVTFEGKPIPEGSTVLFQASVKGASYTATGAIKAGGEYELKYADGAMLPAVAYQIQIQPPSSGAASASSDPAGLAKISTEAPPPPFPAKYSLTAKELSFTVKEGKNSADFELKK